MTKLRYGVFNVDHRWKVFCETERTGLFETRDEAVSAAKGGARAALSQGYEVELYLQDLSGELTRADMAQIAH
jgi:hypothetical protein